MKELIGAIKTKFAGSSLASTYGTLYYDELPETTAKPYAKFTVISSNLDNAMGARYVELTRVQIDLFNTDANALMGHHDTLNTTFDRTTLTLSSGAQVGCARVLNLPLRLEGSEKSGDKVYHVGSDFRCRVDRAY